MIQVQKFDGDMSEATGRPAKYPFAIMQVGDCFKVKTSQGMRSQASAAGRRLGVKFRVLDDTKEMTVIRIA